ncbi:MAG: hypothetical protein WC308_01025 [archaeon]|jgi:hypothetical protein
MQKWFLVIVAIVVLAMVSAAFLMWSLQPVCDYNSGPKTYVKKNPDCVINFLCVQGTSAFSDRCGCGCERIDLNSSVV